MLNKNTIEVLKSITNITNSAIITYPITTFSNLRRDILANVNLGELEDEGWEEFGIFDLGSFLSALGILEDPKIEQDGIKIRAKDSNSEIEFITSYPHALTDFTTNPEIIESTSKAKSVVEATIDMKLLNKIKKGSNIFKNLKDLFIIKEGDKVYLKTGNKTSFNSTSNSYTLDLDCSLNTGDDFSIIIPIESMLSLPAMDYEMKIKHNPSKNSHRIMVENEIFKFLLMQKV